MIVLLLVLSSEYFLGHGLIKKDIKLSRPWSMTRENNLGFGLRKENLSRSYSRSKENLGVLGMEKLSRSCSKKEEPIWVMF